MCKIYTVLVVCTFSVIELTEASFLIPQKNEYKVFATYAIADSESRSLARKHEELYAEMASKINYLVDRRQELLVAIDKLEKENGSNIMLNAERLKLEALNIKLGDLRVASRKLEAFKDKDLSKISIEYGLNETQGLGLSIYKKQDKFNYHGARKNSNTITSADFFYIANMLEYSNFSLVLKPHLFVHRYHGNKENVIQELGFLASYEHMPEMERQHAAYIGLHLGRRLDRLSSSKNLYSLSFMQWTKFLNKVIVSNYTKVDFYNDASSLYKRTIYEQFSLAKELDLGGFWPYNVVFQVGYFWKSSLIDNSFRISGSMLSLWFSL